MSIHVRKIRRKKSKNKSINYEIEYFKLTNYLEDNYPDIYEEYEGGENGKKKNNEEEQESTY